MKTLLACLAALNLSSCVVEPAAPVEISTTERALIGGQVDNDDPGIVGLGGVSSLFCSGTLVSPSVILTAGHCVDDFGGDPNVSILFGTSPVDPDKQNFAVRSGRTHPGWTGNRDLRDGNDLGLLLLAFPQDPAFVIPMNSADLDESFVGASYRHVGFGVSADEVGNFFSDNTKRSGVAEISALSPTIITTDDPDVRVCFGDSGGPGLVTIDGTEYVAGVHSFTSDNCNSSGGDSRVDVHLESFILPFINDNDPTCAADGLCADIGCTDDPDCGSCGADGVCVVCATADPDCPNLATGDICKQDEQCAGGDCVLYLGDGTTRFCSETCTGEGPCPAGMSCQLQGTESICYYDELPPGGVGSTCGDNSECSTELCDDGLCTKECDLPKGLFCPANFECDTRNNVDYYCYPAAEDGGGCGVGGSPSSPWALLLALFGLAWRRRA